MDEATKAGLAATAFSLVILLAVLIATSGLGDVPARIQVLAFHVSL